MAKLINRAAMAKRSSCSTECLFFFLSVTSAKLPLGQPLNHTTFVFFIFSFGFIEALNSKQKDVSERARITSLVGK